jgi:predicted PolB exonuclease-like 3'-5' exonuclease
MENYIVFDIETTGLRPQENQITCICAKDNQDNWFYKSLDCQIEEDIVDKFLKWLERKPNFKLISANGKDFDIPFILIRAYFLNIPYGYGLELKREHFDIINDITSKRISLNDLAKLYGFDLKTGNGENAIKLFQDSNFHELIQYCSNDVRLTEQIYLKYMGLKNAMNVHKKQNNLTDFIKPK